MVKFYKKGLFLEEAEKEKNKYINAGYNAVLLPHRSGGINQPSFRDLKISHSGTLAQILNSKRKLK